MKRHARTVFGFLLLLSVTFFCALSAFGAAISSGQTVPDTLATGQTNSYTFSASVGDALLVRVGAVGFNPRISLYNPSGTLVGTAGSGGFGAVDALLSHTSTNTGTFTVSVSAFNAGQSGTYTLHFARIPGPFIVSPGDQGGALTNGTANSGTNTLGDLDMWSFTANSGDTILLRMGAVGFNPRVDLYDPNGVLLGTAGNSGFGAVDAFLSLKATNSGTFTAVTSAFNLNQSGTYTLHLAHIPGTFVVPPGSAGGALVNGTANPGTNTLGDLTMWSFSANAGDSILLRMGGSGFNPRIDLYDPNGVLLGTAGSGGFGAVDALLSAKATNSGTFTAVTSAFNLNQSGTYTLHLAQIPGAFVISPGNQGGALTNGTANPGTNTLGDLTMWSFNANAATTILLRMGASGFNPRIDLYDPNGVLLGTAGSGGFGAVDALLMVRATNSGTFTAITSAFNLNQSGTYTLHLSEIPGTFVISTGQAGGVLSNGVANLATNPVGNLDMWSFTGNAGDSIMLRMGAQGFNPRIDLYGPDGTLLETAGSGGFGAVDALLETNLTSSGTFTVISSAYNPNQSGTYLLKLAQAPGAVFVSPGDLGGQMINGFTYRGTNALGNLAVWSFYGTVGDSNVFRMVTTNFTPWLRLFGPSGELVAQAFNAGGNNTNFISYVVTNNGNYTLVTSSYFLNQSGTYSLKQSRVPPDLLVPGTQTINDLGTTLNVQISAQDPDIPNQPLTFLTVSAPPTATLATLGATNASFSWTTTDADGPSTNLFVASVTDVVNGKPFTRTNSFTVIVLEVNKPPILPVVAPQTVNELTLLTVTNAATEQDLHSTTAAYGLINAPAGMTISTDGVITWTPAQTESPSTNTITTVVTNNNIYDLVTPQLTATNSFTVVVKEVNQPPALPIILPQTVNELNLLTVTNTAAEPNIHSTTIGYGLVNPPPGVSVSASGVITWTPAQTESPSTNVITTVVTNSNPYDAINPQLTATNSFTVVVKEVNQAPTLPVIAQQTVNELNLLTVTNAASEPNIHSTTAGYLLVNPPPGAAISASGVITWTPTQAQSPSTNTITTVVTNSNPYDAINPHLAATNSFTVVVKEVNEAPTLAAIPQQTISELTLLTITNAASEPNIHSTTTGYALVNPPAAATINASGVISWTPTQAQSPSTNTITTVVTNSNPYDAINPHLTATNSFTVVVKEVNQAPTLPVIVPQSVNELTLLTVTNTAAEPNIHSTTAGYLLVNPPSGVSISASGVITWTPAQAQSPSTNIITTIVTNSNPYDSVSPHLAATNSFTIVVKEANQAPVLAVIPQQTVNELTLLTVTNSASEPNIHSTTMGYGVINPPPGVSISASGVVTWTPAQAQSPSTNTITTVVTNSNPYDTSQPQLTATNSFIVVVKEVNQAPALPIIPLQTVNDLGLLTVINTASEPNIHSTTVGYLLVNPPAGAVISAAGIITWTPTRAQSPSTNTITTVVTNTNPFDLTNPHLSASNSFTVIVTQTNYPPVLQPIADQLVRYGTLLSVQAVATDLDSPPKILTFSLDQAPTNMVINATNGLITWTPVLAQLGTNTVIVRVSDNSQPPLTNTTTFRAIVTGHQPSLGVQAVAGGFIQLIITGDVNVTYQLQISTDLVNWSAGTPITVTASPFLYIDPGSASAPQRFYRLKVN